MTERFTSDLIFILVALIIAALLGFLIGYFLRRIRKARFTLLENEKAQLASKLERTDSQLSDTVRLLESTKKQLADCMSQEKKSAFDAAAAKSVFNMKINENDLKIVEGIGEKIASILNNKGIVTWLQLANTSAEKIKEILLADGGPSYHIHEPATWPEQALMAHEGRWKELKDFQDKLTAGRQN